MNNKTKVSGYMFLLVALALFFLQLGYFFLRGRYQIEYSDSRLFYVLNICIMVLLTFGLFLLLNIRRKWKIVISSFVILFSVLSIILLLMQNNQLTNVVSISPNHKHLLVIKENKLTGEAVYYRTYFRIFARPKESLPYPTTSNFKVEWLANDVAAVTYQSKDHTLHQFIGTYGDRGIGNSYYYVGSSLHGEWKGKNTNLVANTEGITIEKNGKSESYGWENIVQFGTLAVVLVDHNEAKWTVSLNEDMVVDHNNYEPPTGHITLYKATMDETGPIILSFNKVD
ncbi:hypothetical protein [Fredinandcohnia sp. 179-A 10B2 NHS]|uniref:hypothetical protein n=1 Tax=Fredinandcohnia sp. 179-A 10B2 NHS TaxID=3235176 RepID=UPI0039A3B30C